MYDVNHIIYGKNIKRTVPCKTVMVMLLSYWLATMKNYLNCLIVVINILMAGNIICNLYIHWMWDDM